MLAPRGGVTRSSTFSTLPRAALPAASSRIHTASQKRGARGVCRACFASVAGVLVCESRTQTFNAGLYGAAYRASPRTSWRASGAPRGNALACPAVALAKGDAFPRTPFAVPVRKISAAKRKPRSPPACHGVALAKTGARTYPRSQPPCAHQTPPVVVTNRSAKWRISSFISHHS
jgi:hypothetical protein